ncbi:excinuclease ABC subunit UvrA [Campylobacter sp. RM12637]|uniref:excinuclease ABC subunit UvrA n=1 Tax=Campylobacter sp. RM12637 TaxID=2735734 RepID=UPI003014A9B7|nr:excinuclease ABC subunit UvrA [Campylobacter sp. RM12637]
MNNEIQVINASENNLKNISLTLPKNKLIVFTGLSGSGKSTLAFDTLYAEGQRRYIESLSAYARQFLDKFRKPNVEKIEGLTPAIAIDQKSTSKNPRSTVGTITEIYDYLRLLYSKIGVQHCHKCGEKINKMDTEDIINEMAKFSEKAMILAPLVKEKKGTFAPLLESLKAQGFINILINGTLTRLDEPIELAKTKKHTIKLVVDRLRISDDNKSRLAQAVEKALSLSYGECELELLESNKNIHYSLHNACFKCKISFNKLEPLSFSFNSPKGACSLCDGLGIRMSIDQEKIINYERSIEDGAVRTMMGFNKSYYSKLLLAFCEAEKIPTNKPYEELSEYQKKLILYGSATEFSFLWNKHNIKKTFDGAIKISYEILKDDKDFNEYITEKTCPSCKGFRLNEQSLAVLVNGKSIAEVISIPIEEICEFFKIENFNNLNKQDYEISYPIIKEINERLFFLNDVGLGYLTLGRDARTISGGEAQRIRIASQIGSGLSGVLYVLDEPSIGLHERDTQKLINTLKSLQAKGNTLIVVEHDRKTIESADVIVEIGPRAGTSGGEIIFNGTYKELLKSKCETALYINRKKDIDLYKARKSDEYLELSGINQNNIKDLSVKFPLRNLVCVTGVSGSGKSSLMLHSLLPIARANLNRAKAVINDITYKGLDKLDKVIFLDQSPIGKTPRSNPATYTGLMDEIRNLFANVPEAQIRGYKIGRFSFNVAGGRCEKCSGEGELKISMHFLPDVNITCDACGGKRYNHQTLEIKYKDKNIADVLEMSVAEAYEFFAKHPKIKQKLKTLMDVGLDYITLGQNATTLSGGEAQRIKISKELSRSDTGNTLYLLDEPTTGLHFADTQKLVKVLQHLVDAGNSVFVIEHNLDLIKNADYIIDMGPEGGFRGGKIIATGNPLELAKKYADKSYTAKFLAQEFKEMKKELK